MMKWREVNENIYRYEAKEEEEKSTQEINVYIFLSTKNMFYISIELAL